MVYILSFVGSLGRWALSAKQKLIKAKELQECPNPSHNYPGDEVFKSKNLSPELVSEIEAFLTADHSSASASSESLNPPAVQEEPKSLIEPKSSIEPKSLSEPKPSTEPCTSKSAQSPADMEIDLPKLQPGEKIEEPTQEEIADAGLFEFSNNDSWDQESPKKLVNSTEPQDDNSSQKVEASDILTVHVSSNEFEDKNETEICPAQPNVGKRQRELSSNDSLPDSPKPGPSGSSSPIITRSVALKKPAKKKLRSASCSARPLQDPKFLKAISAVQADQLKPHGKMDEIKKPGSPVDDGFDSAIERNLPEIPLVSRGEVDPEAARNLAQMGHYVLLNEADRCGVANHPYINTLLKVTSPDKRSRSLSTARQKQEQRLLATPISPKTAKLSPFTTRGRRRSTSKQINDATRQKIDGKTKNLKPRE